MKCEVENESSYMCGVSTKQWSSRHVRACGSTLWWHQLTRSEWIVAYWNTHLMTEFSNQKNRQKLLEILFPTHCKCHVLKKWQLAPPKKPRFVRFDYWINCRTHSEPNTLRSCLLHWGHGEREKEKNQIERDTHGESHNERERKKVAYMHKE